MNICFHGNTFLLAPQITVQQTLLLSIVSVCGHIYSIPLIASVSDEVLRATG